MISRQPTPIQIVKGHSTAVALSLLDDEGDAVTVDSATITVQYGTEVVATGACTIVDGVATYTIDDDVTADRTPGVGSGDWSVLWSDVVVTDPALDAGTYQIRQAAVLVNTPLLSPITDQDLTDDCPSLAEMVPPTDGTYSGFRVAAFSRLVRRLKRNGKIAGLILDPDATVDYLIADTLAAIYREHSTAIGDPRYRDLANDHAERAAAAWGELVMQYDAYGVGGPTGPDGSAAAAAAVLYTSRPPRRRVVPPWTRG